MVINWASARGVGFRGGRGPSSYAVSPARLLCAACLFAPGVDAASAQTAGRLAGVVRDATGSVLPGVRLSWPAPLLGRHERWSTDEHGDTCSIRSRRPLSSHGSVQRIRAADDRGPSGW